MRVQFVDSPQRLHKIHSIAVLDDVSFWPSGRPGRIDHVADVVRGDDDWIDGRTRYRRIDAFLAEKHHLGRDVRLQRPSQIAVANDDLNLRIPHYTLDAPHWKFGIDRQVAGASLKDAEHSGKKLRRLV